MAKHTDDEIEAFAQELALSDDFNKAYLKAKPNTKASQSSIYSLASRMAKLPAVIKRVSELKSQARVKAESRFAITVEQRLDWLKEIVEAGLGQFTDREGNKRRENLAAARAAIQTMNEMLGVDDGEQSTAEPMTFTFKVSAPKAHIETTNVERD